MVSFCLPECSGAVLERSRIILECSRTILERSGTALECSGIILECSRTVPECSRIILEYSRTAPEHSRIGLGYSGAGAETGGGAGGKAPRAFGQRAAGPEACVFPAVKDKFFREEEPVFRGQGDFPGVSFQRYRRPFLEAVHKAEQAIQTPDIIGGFPAFQGDLAVYKTQGSLNGKAVPRLSRAGVRSGDWAEAGAGGKEGRILGFLHLGEHKGRAAQQGDDG